MVAIKDQPYEYTECGLDEVTIIGITQYHCKACGESYVSIPKIKELHNVIGEIICRKKEMLTGKEMRFLRKEMRMKGTAYAMMLDISAEHLSRMENGAKPISLNLGRLARAMYIIYSREGRFVNDGTFEEIAQQHEIADTPFNIQLNPTDWLIEENHPRACC